MLILSRSPKQKVLIDNNITVEVLKVQQQDNTISLKIEAPETLDLLRSKYLYKQFKGNNYV